MAKNTWDNRAHSLITKINFAIIASNEKKMNENVKISILNYIQVLELAWYWYLLSDVFTTTWL